MTNICNTCGLDRNIPQYYDNGEPLGEEMMNTLHDCHCVSVDGIRVAWGICCAKHSVGVSLMKEEDYHDKRSWRLPEDCTCPIFERIC